VRECDQPAVQKAVCSVPAVQVTVGVVGLNEGSHRTVQLAPLGMLDTPPQSSVPWSMLVRTDTRHGSPALQRAVIMATVMQGKEVGAAPQQWHC
jgi:hypothetical protein